MPGESDELDLDAVRAVQLDDRTEVAGAQTMFWDVAVQDDGIEHRKRHGDP